MAHKAEMPVVQESSWECSWLRLPGVRKVGNKMNFTASSIGVNLMPINASQLEVLNDDIPVLNSIYSPQTGIGNKLGTIKPIALDIERQINRSVYLISDLYSSSMSTGVLFYRKSLGEKEGYIYFGLAGKHPKFSSSQLEINLPNGKNIFIFLLNVAGSFDHGDLLLFAFETNKFLEVSQLIRDPYGNVDDHCYFSGFQTARDFDLDKQAQDNVDYFLLSDSLQKVYASELQLTYHHTYSYGDSLYDWAQDGQQQVEGAEQLCILRGMPFEHIVPGGAVFNPEGRLTGILKSTFGDDLALISDIRPVLEDLKQHTLQVLKRHKPRQFRVG